MDDYIPKPVILKTLKETIFKWLDKGNTWLLSTTSNLSILKFYYRTINCEK